jgi:ubiquinone/menaquinone biosynthesis C-methylase UbiE
MELCLRMVRDISEEKLRDPNTTYLDNSCGDGNFLVALFTVLTEDYGHDPSHVLNHQLYGVDIMEDNVSVARSRLGLSPGTPGWAHVVCADALAYDYQFSPVE